MNDTDEKAARKLLTAAAVRERAHELLAICEADGLAEWRVDLTRLEAKQVYIVGSSPREERRLVQLAGGQTSDVLTFERTAPAGGSGADTPYQVTVRLGTRDALPFNNVRYATFLVRGARKLFRDPGNQHHEQRMVAVAPVDFC